MLLSLLSVVGAVVTYKSTAALDWCTGRLVAKPDGTFGCSGATDAFRPEATAYIVASAIITLLLLVGSILLFLRTMAGRVIVIIVGAVSALVGFGTFTPAFVGPEGTYGPFIGLIQPLLSLLLLALAAAPSTGGWIQAARQRPSYPQGNYQRY
ncbi:hypothetical protein [Nocardia sp. XZ_19_231]|uniref:hypothetical protein n=1 Tax=Nocardia sp. XZ_19_231 TaxID=2769252 RepID=UPI00188E78CF|nr:hypothetical protein [Nocardia sp. XZ_19_231]